MAIIPLRQTITVERGETIDEFGRTVPEEILEFNCRVDEGTFLIKSRSSSNVSSKEVVATAKILLDRLQDIRYEDTVIYENELGDEMHAKPERINVKRNMAGKPILTEVFV